MTSSTRPEIRRTPLARTIFESGLDRKEIAVRIGVSPSTLTRWCNGEREVPLTRLVQLAELLGVTEDAITNGTSNGRA